MTNEEREAQRAIFESGVTIRNTKANFKRSSRFPECYDNVFFQTLFDYWILALESQPKREIRLPEKESSECVVGDFYGHDGLTKSLEDQGFTVL